MAGGTFNHDNLACKAVTLINNYFEENDFPYLVNYKWEVEIERGRPVKNQNQPKGVFYKKTVVAMELARSFDWLNFIRPPKWEETVSRS